MSISHVLRRLAKLLERVEACLKSKGRRKWGKKNTYYKMLYIQPKNNDNSMTKCHLNFTKELENTNNLLKNVYVQ